MDPWSRCKFPFYARMIYGRIDFDALPRSPDATLGPSCSTGVADRNGIGSLALPGVELVCDGLSAESNRQGTIIVLATGAPRFVEHRIDSVRSRDGIAAAWLSLYREYGRRAPRLVKGPYSVAILDPLARRALLATDRFALQPLCYVVQGSCLTFSDRADTISSKLGLSLDPQALYDYLYFHVIPAPRTAFRSVQRLLAGHSLSHEDGKFVVEQHWAPVFEEDARASIKDLAQEFRALVSEAVRVEADGFRVGSFLSGGTDSSTIVGMLRAVTGRRPKTFSIGFDAHGYDEMAYARITARYFDTEHHEHYLTPEELIDAIPKVASSYDQPFGNSSAVPTYYCALLAKAAGLDKMLAGDGGDELFGGNTRYAKQKVFAAYDLLPRALRRSLIEPLLLNTQTIQGMPILGKAASYVRQARMPMPDRMSAYNLLHRTNPHEILTEDFLNRVDLNEPAEHERQTYATCSASSLANRMLTYDWKFTLADNDLPKVTGTASLAGIRVGFPLLADELVDFSLKLRPDLKVRGLRLRYFFKEACRGFLPDETLRKRKHGFGLPFGIWLTQNRSLHSLATDALSQLARRGLVKRQFIGQLVDRQLADHPGYYGELVWILMMMEHWLARADHAERGADVFSVINLD